MTEERNIADALAEHLPHPHLLVSQTVADLTAADGVLQVALPSNFTLKELDLERLLPHPRRTVAKASLMDAASFIDYVNRHAQERSVVWCAFNPANFSLSFTAVIDEHDAASAGWRSHQAVFVPSMSSEWKTWSGQDRKAMDQLPFAEFIESNENDIAAVEGMPSSLEMHKMATEFVARQDMSIKSAVRSQNGGVQLTYIADADSGTYENMKLFERFALGIPVFWEVPQEGRAIAAYPLHARLRYRLGHGKVMFFYELIRPDLVHQRASLELIDEIREGIGAVPLIVGSCS